MSSGAADRASERRASTRSERRGGDRRGSGGNGSGNGGGRRHDDSWLRGPGDSVSEGDSGVASESLFAAGWLAASDAPVDSRFLLRQARRLAQAQDGALVRVYRTYAAARAAIGVGLVFAQALGNLFGGRFSEWTALVSLAYAAQAVTLWLLPRFGALAKPQSHARQRRRHWLVTIGVDLLAFSLLYLLEVGSPFNYAALLVLPVLMSGVLTSRLLALGTAAAVALLFLLGAWRAALGGVEVPTLMLQSGLAGMGMFAIALLSGELAWRLAREEGAARGSLELARQQAQLNRLVIEEMADGVLVVDRRLRVRAANPAARALLVTQGMGPPAPFSFGDRSEWEPLRSAAEQALTEGTWPDAGRDVGLSFDGGYQRTLRLRVRFMRAASLAPLRGLPMAPPDAKGSSEPPEAGEPFAVLLLEDLRTLQARMRQEKLAAMGRVSAGIAHEIRNPLAAISQANALLMEDLQAEPQRRLAQMVADNAARLKRLVDEVMELSPGGPPSSRGFDACAAVAGIVADWAQTVGMNLDSNARLRIELPALAVHVSFDPEHLRRLLVNLLDNAHRHAGPAPGSIFLRLAARDDHWAVLAVLSEGEIIGPEVERHLFEPFFSTRSRGSGLGLYICRELCERHGASIDYRPRPNAERLRNEFVVSLRRVASPAAEWSDELNLQPATGTDP